MRPAHRAGWVWAGSGGFVLIPPLGGFQFYLLNSCARVSTEAQSFVVYWVNLRAVERRWRRFHPSSVARIERK